MEENIIKKTKKERNIAPFSKLNLMDDFLFDVITSDLEACKDIVELILEEEIVNIRWKEGQKVIHNLPDKRGVRMDFYVEDQKGRIIDVEMQKRNVGNIPKRTRFYQALLDAPLLPRGEQNFDQLNPILIIVICPFDLYGQGFYRYTFENRCQEKPDLVLGDESRKIFLNTRGIYKNGVSSALVDFLHYVEKSNDQLAEEAEDVRIKRLHEKVCAVKASEVMEVEYMKMEEREWFLKEEAKKEGQKEGKVCSLFELIQKKLQRGLVPKEIADLLEEDVQKIERMASIIREDPQGDPEDWYEILCDGRGE